MTEVQVASAEPSAHERMARQNEGGHLHYWASLEALGLTRSVVETFNVGAYRCTQVDDAIAQPMRVRSTAP